MTAWTATAATIWNRVYEQARDEGHTMWQAIEAANWYCRNHHRQS